MKFDYRLRNPETIPSPALLFYRDLIRKNLCELVRMVGSPARLRPHVKTHKTREIVLMGLELGITKHKCATIAEAEMLAMIGVPDVLIAYPMVGPNMARLAKLMKQYPKTRFSSLVDHPLATQELGRVMQSAGLTLDVVLDLNVGMDRTGIALAAGAFELYRQIARTDGLRADGLQVYDGHNTSKLPEERVETAGKIMHEVQRFCQQLAENGLPIQRLVCGGTPSFRQYEQLQLPGLELSPGTVALYDRGYESKYGDLAFTPAAVLLTRVISRPTPDRLTLDLGYKAVSGDQPAGSRCILLDLPDAKMVMHSEEHLVVETPEARHFVPGDVVYAIPTHVCPTVALHAKALIVEDGAVTGEWAIAARDRMLTV